MSKVLNPMESMLQWKGNKRPLSPFGEEVKHVYVLESEKDEEGWVAPSSYWIRSALGGWVYFKTRSRVQAQTMCDTMFGVGKYVVAKEIKNNLR